MITYTTGNLLSANAEALVNTVNTVGVMGKGIALQFKERFPENYKLYKAAAKSDELQIGSMFTVPTHRMDGAKWIINFPTKKHWRHPSKLAYIEAGLDDLIYIIQKLKMQSIAIPPLGCGNGGLDWSVVKRLMAQKLSILEGVQIYIYEPSDTAYEEKTKKEKQKPKLTPTRAIIVHLMKSYAQFQYSLTVLETQKLVYFLSRLGDDEAGRIRFEKGVYGPYAPVLNRVLYDMDGVYITGMKFMDAKTFDPLLVAPQHTTAVTEFIETHATGSQKSRVATLLHLIEGFETPLSMELLATVDYVLVNEVQDIADLTEVIYKVHQWNRRKQELMPPAFIEVAYMRLMEFKTSLYA